MKTIVIVLVSLLFLSCLSPGQLTVEPAASSAENQQSYATAITVKFSSDPQLDAIFNQAIVACENQQWEKAIDLFADGAAKSPKDIKGNFVKFLTKLTDDQFPVQQACQHLIELDPQERIRWETLLATANSDPFSIDFPAEPLTLEWIKASLALKNHPVVQVLVNGKPLRLMVDTGTQVVNIFESPAKTVDIRNFPELAMPTIDLYGNKSAKTARYGLVKSLQIGGITVHNSHVCVIPDQYMWAGIDGFLGWNVLSQMSVEFDYQQKTISFGPSSGVRAPVRNFYWLDYPIIKSVYEKFPNQLFYLGLDTGASYSFFADYYLNTLQLTKGARQKTTTWGVNGAKEVEATQLPQVPVYLDGSVFNFKNYWNKWRTTGNGFSFNGVLGSDIAQLGKLRLDYKAGRISFTPY